VSEASCAVVTCDAPVERLEWCETHHRRFKRTGSPYGRFARYEDPDLVVDYGEKTCSVEDCIRPAVARGLCARCLRRAKRTGEELPPTFRQFYAEGTLCVIVDCEAPVCARGWCKRHWHNWNRTGNPLGIGRWKGKDNNRWVGDHVGYPGMHDRVKRALGPATDYWCVDSCGDQAEDWSYDHLDPEEHVQEVKTRYRSGAYWSWLPFSLDITHYQPRCEPCHLRLDKRYAKRARSAFHPSPYEDLDADFSAQAQDS
jgi:hypothetical protein